jgi:hypothetical protein
MGWLRPDRLYVPDDEEHLDIGDVPVVPDDEERHPDDDERRWRLIDVGRLPVGGFGAT